MPAFSDDDVLNFQVTEAVILKVMQEREQQQKQAERAAWKSEHRKLPKGGGS